MENLNAANFINEFYSAWRYLKTGSEGWDARFGPNRCRKMRTRDINSLLERLITVSVGKRKAAQAARWIHLDLHLMPLRFALNVRRIKPDRVLMSKLQGDARAYLDELRLVISVREERSASGHASNFFEHRTPKPRQRVACRVGDPNRVNLNIRFFNPVAKLLVGISAVIVLPVRDYQQRLLGVTALLDLFNGDVCRIVERCRAMGRDEHQMAKHAIARNREVLNQLRPIVERDQEEVVILVRSLDESPKRANRPVDALLHRA